MPKRAAIALIAPIVLLLATPAVAAQKPRESVGAPRRPAPAPAAPRLGSLVVVSDPAGAEIALYHLGGRRPALVTRATTDAGGSHTFGSLAAGRYRVVARYPEHQEFAEEVSIVAGRPESVSAKLRPTFGYVVLAGPDLGPEARVLLDGVRVGVDAVPGAPLRVKALPGTHEVRVERAGRASFATSVSVVAGEERATFVALEPLRATLVVRSEAGARVFVDDRAAGTISSTGRLVVEGVAPGAAHEVRVELDDHTPFTQKVTPAASVETAIDAPLELLPTSGPFEETFLGGLTRWEAPATWRVDTGTGVLDVRGEGTGTPKGLLYRDCEVVFNLRLVDGRGAAWVVRARDPRNAYLFHLSGPKGRWPNQLRAYLVRDGAVDLDRPSGPPLPVDPPLVAGEFYRIRVRVEGDVVRHWITSGATGAEVSVGLFQDLERTFPSGSAGFAAVDGSEFQVEGFVIRPIK